MNEAKSEVLQELVYGVIVSPCHQCLCVCCSEQDEAQAERSSLVEEYEHQLKDLRRQVTEANSSLELQQELDR